MLSSSADISTAAGTRQGVVFVDSAGLLSRIAVEGEDFDVAVGDRRTVEAASIVGSLGNGAAVYLRFSDLSEGIFLVTIPEPGTGVLVSIGLLVMAARERRRRR